MDDDEPLGVPGPVVGVNDELARRNDFLEREYVLQKCTVSKLKQELSALRSLFAYERIERSAEHAQIAAWNEATTTARADNYTHLMRMHAEACRKRTAAQIQQQAAEHSATDAALICSIGDLEEELAQRTEKLTQTARAQVAELDAAHTAHATALQTNLERTRARLKASEELAALRGRQLESHRRIVRNQAEENLVEQRALRAKLRADAAANVSTLTSAIGHAEGELEAQAAWYEFCAATANENHAAELAAQVQTHECDVQTLRELLSSLMSTVDAAEIERQEAARQDSEAREARHAREIAELRAQGAQALAQQDAALRAEMAWEREAARVAQEAQDATIQDLRERLHDEEMQRAREVTELRDRLKEHSAALAASRRAWDGACAEAARVDEERRRDALLCARIERERSIYRLETGMPLGPGDGVVYGVAVDAV